MAIDFGAMGSTGIHAVAYNRLRTHLEMKPGRTRMYDLSQQLAEPEADILERFGADVITLRGLTASYGYRTDRWRRDTLPDGSACEVPAEFQPQKRTDGGLQVVQNDKVISVMPAGGFWFDQVWHPLASATSVADLDRFPVNRLTSEDTRWLENEAKRLYTETDKAILGEFGGSLYERGQTDFGFQNFMTLMLVQPDLITAYLDRLLEAHLANLEIYLKAAGKYIQVIQFGDDLGTQTSLQLSPQVYRRFFKPRHARMFQYVHEHSTCKVFLHSCGAIYPLIPDLIDAGVDILNPVQISAPNMQPEKLKNEFGKQLTFWGGGCDTQYMLPRAPMDELRRHILENIQIFSKGGGFVFNQVHNIQQDVAPERIAALYQLAVDNR